MERRKKKKKKLELEGNVHLKLIYEEKINKARTFTFFYLYVRAQEPDHRAVKRGGARIKHKIAAVNVVGPVVRVLVVVIR